MGVLFSPPKCSDMPCCKLCGRDFALLERKLFLRHWEFCSQKKKPEGPLVQYKTNAKCDYCEKTFVAAKMTIHHSLCKVKKRFTETENQYFCNECFKVFNSAKKVSKH